MSTAWIIISWMAFLIGVFIGYEYASDKRVESEFANFNEGYQKGLKERKRKDDCD